MRDLVHFDTSLSMRAASVHECISCSSRPLRGRLTCPRLRLLPGRRQRTATACRPSPSRGRATATRSTTTTSRTRRLAVSAAGGRRGAAGGGGDGWGGPVPCRADMPSVCAVRALSVAGHCSRVCEWSSVQSDCSECVGRGQSLAAWSQCEEGVLSAFIVPRFVWRSGQSVSQVCGRLG